MIAAIRSGTHRHADLGIVDGRKAVLQIKKEVQEFIIASEGLYRLFSKGDTLSCHESEILSCCLDELVKRRSPLRIHGFSDRPMS